MFRQITGMAPQSTQMRALYGAIKTLEERGVASIEWSMDGFNLIAEHVKSPDARRQLEIQAQGIFGGAGDEAGDGLDPDGPEHLRVQGREC